MLQPGPTHLGNRFLRNYETTSRDLPDHQLNLTLLPISIGECAFGDTLSIAGGDGGCAAGMATEKLVKTYPSQNIGKSPVRLPGVEDQPGRGSSKRVADQAIV